MANRISAQKWMCLVEGSEPDDLDPTADEMSVALGAAAGTADLTLTPSEVQLILEVVERDHKLRHREDLRISRLKAELQHLRRKGALRVGLESGRTCARCRAQLGRIINRGAPCRACRMRVCKSCREYTENGRDWVCSVCHKHIEIQLASGEWMNEFVPSGSRRDRDSVAPTDHLSRQIKRSWTIASPAENSQSSPDLRALRALPANSARREGGGAPGGRPRPRPRPERQPTRRASMSGAENGWYRDEYKRARSFDDLSSSASSSAANSPFVQKRPGRPPHLYASVDGAAGGVSGLGNSHCMRLPSITYIRADAGDANTRSLPRSTRVHISPQQLEGGSLPRQRRPVASEEPLYANLAALGRPPPPTKPPRKASPQSGGARRLPADLRRQMEERRRAAAGLPLDPPRPDRGDLPRTPRSRSESEAEREAAEAAYRRAAGRRRGSLDTGRGSGASDLEQDAESASGGAGGVFRRLAAQVRGRSPELTVTAPGRAGNSVVLLNTSPPRELGRGRSPGARRARLRSPPPPTLGRPVVRVSSLGRYDTDPERRRHPRHHHHHHPQQQPPRLERPPPVDEYDIHRRAVQEAVRLPLGLPELRPGQVAEYIEIPRHYNERAIDVDGEPASKPPSEHAQRDKRPRSEPRTVHREPEPQAEARAARNGKPSPPRQHDQREKRIAIEMEQRSTGRPPGQREKPVDLAAIGREPHRLLPHDFSSLPRPSQLRKRNRERSRANNTTVVNMNADYATLPRRPQTSKVILNTSPTHTPPDPWRASATSTPNLEAEVLRAVDISPRPASEANSDIMLDHSKIQPESDDYKLVFISSDSCRDSEHNSSVEMDSPQPIVSKIRTEPNTKQAQRPTNKENADWNIYQAPAKHKSQFAKTLAREAVPSKSRSGKSVAGQAANDAPSPTSKKFTPIQGNSSKILFIFDDSDSPQSTGPSSTKAVSGQAGTPVSWPETLDFSSDAALSSMMHQTEQMQAEAEALQTALLSNMERPRPLQLGQTLAEHPPEPDATLERCRNMVLSEIRQHRRDRRTGAGDDVKNGDGQKIVYGDHCVKVIIAGDGSGAEPVEAAPLAGDLTLPRLVHKSVTRISPAVTRSKSFSASPSEALLRRRKPQRHFSLHDRPHDRPRRPLQRRADRDARDGARDGGRDGTRHETETEKRPETAPARSVGDGQEPAPEVVRRDPSWVRAAAEQRTDPSGASSSDDDEKANREKAAAQAAGSEPPVEADQVSTPLQYRAGQVTSGDVLQYFERLTREKSAVVSGEKSSGKNTADVRGTAENADEPADEVQSDIVVSPVIDHAVAHAGAALPPPVEHDCISLSNLTEVPVDSEPELEADAASVVTAAEDPVSQQIDGCTQETSVDNSDSEYAPGETERPQARKHGRRGRDAPRTAGESESGGAAKPGLPDSAAGGGGSGPQSVAGAAAERTERHRARPPHAEKPPDDDTGQPPSPETATVSARKPQGSPSRTVTEQQRTSPPAAAKTGPGQSPASPDPHGAGSLGTDKNPDNSASWQAAGMGVGTAAELAVAARTAAAPVSGGSAGVRPARPRPAIPAKPVFARPATARCADTATPGAAETLQSITSTPGAAAGLARHSAAAAAAEGRQSGDVEKNRTAGDPKASAAAGERRGEVSSSERSAAADGQSGDSVSDGQSGDSVSDSQPRGFVSVIAVADSQTPVTVTNVTSRDGVPAETPRQTPAAAAPEKASPPLQRSGSEQVEVVTDAKTNSVLVSAGGDSGDSADMSTKTSELQSLIARSREAQGEFVYTTVDREQSPDTTSKLADYFAGLDSPAPAQYRRSASHRTPEVRRHPLFRSPDRRRSESPLSEHSPPRQDDAMSDTADQPASLDVSGSDIVLGDRRSDGHSDARASDEDIASDDFDDGFDFGGEDGFRDEFEGDQFDSDERFSPDESFSDGSYQDEPYQEEDIRYSRPIDFTLTTILEESCEESDDDRSSKGETPTAHPSEFEKYFLFDLGNGPHDPVKYANEESEYSDTFSETTESVYSEFMEQEDADLDPVQQASQRYFTKGFLGLTRRLSARSTGDDSENPTDGSGSVGSDSETVASPQRRRKRRSRSGARAPPADTGAEAAPAGSEHSDVTSSDDDVTAMEVPDAAASGTASAQNDSQHRRTQNTIQFTEIPAKQRISEKPDREITEKARLADGSAPSQTTAHSSKLTDGVGGVSGGTAHRIIPGLAAGLNQVDKTGEAHQSRDSGFLGSSDDLLKEAVIREAEERSAEEAGARLTSDSSLSDVDSCKRPVGGLSSQMQTKKDILYHKIMSQHEVSSTLGPVTSVLTTSASSEIKGWQQTTSKSPAAWDSTAETSQLMGRLRHLFRTTLNSARRRGAARPLASLEPQLTRLVRTVPGLTDPEVSQMVEYLSCEDTWSDSSELEGACAALNPAQPDIMTQIQQEIAESCQHIIRRYEPDVIADLPTAPMFERRPPPLGLRAEAAPPLKLAQVMRQVGGRLLSLMLEVTAAAEAADLPANQTTATHEVSASTANLQAALLPQTTDTGQPSSPPKPPASASASDVTVTPPSAASALKSEPGEREFNRILRDSQRRKKRVIDSFQDLPDSLVSPEEREILSRLCGRLGAGDDSAAAGSDSDSVPRAADVGGIGPRAGFACRRSLSGCELPSQRRAGLPEVTDKRCTLPRSAPPPAPPNATGSLSLPRRSATAPMLNVSSLGPEPRSARYRPPGFRPLPAAARRAASARRVTPPPNPEAAPGVAAVTPPASRSPTPRRSCAPAAEDTPSGDTDRLLDTHSNSTLRSRSASLASLQSTAEARFGTVPVRGDIQLAVQYRREQALLELLVRQCRHLAAADARRNKSDPYVKVYLLPDRTKNGKRKTKIKKNSLNPIFDEALAFPVAVADLAGRTLWVTVWHSDMFGRNHFLGEVLLPLGESLLQHPAPTWYPLQERSELHEESGGGRGHGDVIVALKFAPAEGGRGRTRGRGTLHVLVKEAKHLQAIRSNGSADPFCKCYLLPDRKGSKQKTAVVRRSTSPRWAGALTFSEVTTSELRQRALELSVWDHSLTTNELLGAARFNTGSGQHEGRRAAWMDASGQECSLWEQMLDRPGFWVEGSVPLRPSLEPGACADK